MPETATLKLQLNVQVGAFTEPRYRNLLREVGADRYPQYTTPVPGQPMGVLSSNDGRNALIITPDALIFQHMTEGTPDFATGARDLEAACRGLLLEPTGTGAVQMVKTYEYPGNALDDSLSWTAVAKETLLSWAASLAGVGLKLYVRSYGDLGEVRVEPFLADPSHLYVEATVNYSQPMGVEELAQRAEDFWAVTDENVIAGLLSSLRHSS